jgi:class 3 adenylate cyclase
MFTDPKVAEEVLRSDIVLGGEQREVSVLFCDIRGFTGLTQHMAPPAVIQLLNDHMTALTPIVRAHHGVVDKFVGDLIMAVFGAPTSHGHDATHAAACALRIMAERGRLNAGAAVPLQVGIGIATGNVVAGCMGSSDKVDYTVLGQRVNLASRLCSKAGPMEVIIDDVTRARLGAAAVVQALAPLALKGFDTPVSAWQLLELREPSPSAEASASSAKTHG